MAYKMKTSSSLNTRGCRQRAVAHAPPSHAGMRRCQISAFPTDWGRLRLNAEEKSCDERIDRQKQQSEPHLVTSILQLLMSKHSKN